MRICVLILGLASAQTTAAFAAGAITLTPPSLTVCAAAVNTKQFNASHGNFTQTATSLNTSIATVSPAGGTGGNVNYTVTGHTAGSTTINLTDTQGASGAENVSVNGPISVSGPLTFSGTTASQNITVTEPGPNVLVSATSSDTTVATVVASATTSSNTATLAVTPVNGSKAGITPATATITITDAAGCASKTVNVSVSPGTLTTSGGPLTFSGSLTPQSFTAAETDYTGLLSAASGNTALANVAPASGNGPGPVSFTVTPTGTAFGSTSITVTDNHTGSASVNVLVTGGTIAIPGSSTATFTANDNANAHLSGSSIRVTGSLQTTASGTGQIAVKSPANITGTHGGSLLIGYLTYNCTANGSGNDQGGTFAPGFLSLIASAQAANCVTFPATDFATLDFNLNLFLDDRAVKADTYTGSGFQVVLSAT